MVNLIKILSRKNTFEAYNIHLFQKDCKKKYEPMENFKLDFFKMRVIFHFTI